MCKRARSAPVLAGRLGDLIMDISKATSVHELRVLVAACDDTAGHHCVWVDRDGIVHIDAIREDLGPVEFEASHPMAVRFPTYEQGGGYVGPAAADDDVHIAYIYKELLRGWANRKTGHVIYMDGFDG